MVLVTTICRQINGLSSSASHQDLSTTVTLRQVWTVPRIQATGSVEVRGGGSALGHRQGGSGDVAEKSLWGDLAF